MVHKFALLITNRLSRSVEIVRDNSKLFIYSVEITFSSMCSIIAALLLSAIFKQLYFSIAYLTSFILTRQFSGGYHAKSYMACFLKFICIFLVSLLLLRPLLLSSVAIALLSLTMCISILLIHCPINSKKILSIRQRIFGKSMSVTIASLFGSASIFIITYEPQYVELASGLLAALVTVSFLVVIETIKVRRNIL